MIGRNLLSLTEVEPIVSEIAHSIYFKDSYMVLNRDDFNDYCVSNGVEADACFIAECKLELEELIEQELSLSKETGNFRLLRVTLYRILGVSKFLFAEKLVAVSEAYVEVVSLISKARSCSDTSANRGTAEYALKTMHLMLQQVLAETVEYLDRRFKVLSDNPASVVGSVPGGFAAFGMHCVDEESQQSHSSA